MMTGQCRYRVPGIPRESLRAGPLPAHPARRGQHPPAGPRGRGGLWGRAEAAPGAGAAPGIAAPPGTPQLEPPCRGPARGGDVTARRTPRERWRLRGGGAGWGARRALPPSERGARAPPAPAARAARAATRGCGTRSGSASTSPAAAWAIPACCAASEVRRAGPGPWPCGPGAGADASLCPAESGVTGRMLLDLPASAPEVARVW